ncbi:hypothetical protein RJT34_30515 [Clitoria ternatea]|uniref:Transmembrane protein n=1 Tax=Clitoria ternatea TaxID=43366 RepID=A0AAN9ESJ4_CLITE
MSTLVNTQPQVTQYQNPPFITGRRHNFFSLFQNTTYSHFHKTNSNSQFSCFLSLSLFTLIFSFFLFPLCTYLQLNNFLLRFVSSPSHIVLVSFLRSHSHRSLPQIMIGD